MTSRGLHLPWCAERCAAVVTGVHESRPTVVPDRGLGVVDISVAVERLVGTPPVNLVVLEFVQDHMAEQYRLPLGQVRTLQHALRGAFRRLATG